MHDKLPDMMAFLKEIPFFSEVSDKSLSGLIENLTVEVYHRNDTVFSSGDAGDSMFAIYSGKVRVHEEGHDYAYLARGDCFGEYALIDNRPRSASVTALEETRLIRIGSSHFIQLIEKDRGFAQGILAEMIKRHRELDEIQSKLSSSRAKLVAANAKMTGLLNGAMDAIILFNKGYRIILTNASANVLLENEDVIQRNLLHFLDEEGSQMLESLIQSPTTGPEGPVNKFLPAPIKVIGSMEGTTLNEGTLSSYSEGNSDYHILILRNIEERLLAEDKIELLTKKANYLEEEIKELTSNFGIIAGDDSMTFVFDQIAQVAVTDATVLIQGETGTGKELVARAIHDASLRATKPLIRINCGAIPANLIESELFGHEKGAFTGAVASRKGRFLLADKGTIFLDEIGELPSELQPKLLRVIQEGEFDPVGSSKTIKVDVRIIAATHRDLQALSKKGKFREDLYYRLNVFPIQIPALRERGDDVLLIAREMISKLSVKLNKRAIELSEADKSLFKNYDWPGNVRELQNLIERAVIISKNGQVNWSAIVPGRVQEVQTPASPTPDKIFSVEEIQELERYNILKALKRTSWRISGPAGAARLLGLPPTTLASKIKSLGITRPV